MPFLYDIIGGSLKISLGSGCCCTKCHSLIYAGREIAPNAGANATKFFTLATKS